MTTIIVRAHDTLLSDLPDFDPSPLWEHMRTGLARAEARLGRTIVAAGRLEFKMSRDALGNKWAQANFHLVSAGGDAEVFVDELRPELISGGPYRPVQSEVLRDVGGVIYAMKGRIEGIRSASAYRDSAARPSKHEKIAMDVYHSRYTLKETVLLWRCGWDDLGEKE